VKYSSDNWGVMLNNAVFTADALTSTRALSYLLSPMICVLLITLALVTMASRLPHQP
jgi:peptide/nickel transport system permease protein